MDKKDDAPARVAPRDASLYAVLFFLVIPLFAVIPISWAFVIHSLYTGTLWSLTWQGRLCFVFALAEVKFHFAQIREKDLTLLS